MRELLATLRENKIHISLENENLKLKFDGDGIPDSILETIKKNKEQLILFLKNNNQPNRLISAIPKVEQQEDYALSSAQHSIWLLSQIDVVALGYNISEIFKFKGTLNIEILELAIKEVIKRHEILRTVFKQNSFGEVRQFILSPSDFKFNLNYADVSNLEDPEKKLEKIIDDEIGYQFDLSSESLFRVNLIRTGSEEIVLCFVIQHIISDGWSINLLINEMLTFYMAFCQNKSIRLEPLRIQYKDYSEWQQNNLNSELLEKNKLFWTNQFNDELPVLELPTLKARPIVKTYNVNTLWHNYSDDFLSKLKMISKNGDTTLFSTLMSVMNLLLYRYSGQDDVILGTAIAGRENQELENQIGMYINTLAIRTKLNGSENFTELLSKLKNVLLQAFQHQDYPFNELINELKHKRSKNRSPLFDILVILQNQKSIQANEFKVSDLEISKISEYQNSTSQFDMKFEFFEMENGLKLGLEYNTDIYDSAFIHRFFSHFENIVDSIFQNSELPIGHLSYLSKEEVNQLLLGFNDTKMVYPDTKTVIDLFEDQVEKTPESIAVVFEEIELTYKELNEKSNQLAHYLRENHAIQPDDLIAVKLDRSEKIIIAILGVLKSGAAYVPIDVNYPKERIAYIEKDSNSKIVIDEKVLEKFSEIQENFPKENIVKINNPHDLVYVIYTSGTTGNPKGVMVEHGNLVSSTISRIEFYQVQKTLLLISSYAFDSSVAVIWGGLINGGTLVIENESVIKDSESIVKRIIKSEVTDMLCVPSYYGFLFNELKKNKDSLKLKNLILAGEQVKLDLIASHKEDFESITLFNEYGPTEGTVWATVFKINDFENLVIPIGRPISNTQIYILDDNLEPVVIGGSGKLYVSGSGVAR
ncbi:condensation domain-containing protein, partial [Flavobacterium collinsii]|uniref:non-ribosomal peptide synthetase n=1 Tax=Flavobacterium collinsii TaxID=1114861 RepID=UPI0037562F54